jgi:hypothetical protein
MRERKILVHSTDDPGRDFAICSFATAYKSDQCPDTGCKLISEDLVFVDINAETPPDIMSKSAMSKMVAAIKEKTNTGKVLFPYFYVHRGAVKKAHFLYAEWGENTFKLNFNKTDTVMV